MRLIRSDDRWLFLTPEIEREVPSLMEAIGQGDAATEQRRIDALIRSGTIARWFAYLRDCRRRLEQAATGADRTPSRGWPRCCASSTCWCRPCGPTSRTMSRNSND